MLSLLKGRPQDKDLVVHLSVHAHLTGKSKDDYPSEY